MTKMEMEARLRKAVGNTDYGQELIEDLAEHYGAAGKYAQNAKDRLDEIEGNLERWVRTHLSKGDLNAARLEDQKIAIVQKAKDALK